ncbi:MAG: nonstructural protein [Microvirus sp.]|nr:MAG: nonstructural protein [Microvirus sp.]
MIYHVCVIRDRAIDAFGVPIFVAAIGQAVRSFTDEVNRKGEGNQMNMHPEDFDLYVLGTYNGDLGTFDAASPRQIAIGKDVYVSQ